MPVVRPEDIDQIAFDVMALIGDFMKPEFVKYNIGTCAGGYADFKGCGICIPYCPVDAISDQGGIAATSPRSKWSSACQSSWLW